MRGKCTVSWLEKLLTSSLLSIFFFYLFSSDFFESLDGFHFKPVARNLKNAGLTPIHTYAWIYENGAKELEPMRTPLFHLDFT